MPLIKIKQNYQITIPQKLRKKFNVSVGDYLEIETQKEGLIIKPVKVIHPDQEYFYTPEWQKKRRKRTSPLLKVRYWVPFTTLRMRLRPLKRPNKEE